MTHPAPALITRRISGFSPVYGLHGCTPMSRMDQLFEQLFVRTGARVVLESDACGVLESPHLPDEVAFTQPLSTGQILLLFAEVVPRDLSPGFLRGEKTAFAYDTRHGTVLVSMELLGPTARVVLRAADGVATRISGRGNDAAELKSVLRSMAALGASHLHLAGDAAVLARIDGRLVEQAQVGRWTSEALRRALVHVAPENARASVERAHAFSFATRLDDEFVHVRGDEGHAGLCVVVRRVVQSVPTPSALGLPPSLVEHLEPGGLWLFGALSTHDAAVTMASVTQALLQRAARCVVTIDAPRQALLDRGLGMVQSLEVDEHLSTREALAIARNSDADVICLADSTPDALREALRAASPHQLLMLVRTAASTQGMLDDALSTLPSTHWASLAATLKGTLTQRTVRQSSGMTTLATELRLVDDALAESLRQGHAPASAGLDQALSDLVGQGRVSADEALRVANDRTWLASRLTRHAA